MNKTELKELLKETVTEYVGVVHGDTARRAYTFIKEIYDSQSQAVFEDKKQIKETEKLLTDLQSMLNYFSSFKR